MLRRLCLAIIVLCFASLRAELHAHRGSGTIEINSRVYERARKPRALECRAKIGGDLCAAAARAEPLQNSYLAGSPLLGPLPTARVRIVIRERWKVVRGEGGGGPLAMTRSPLSLWRGSRAGVDVSPRLLTRREREFVARD